MWIEIFFLYCQLRARRALLIFNDVPLRSRRVLSLYKVYGDSALLVLNGTLMNSVNALLVLNGTLMNSVNALLVLNGTLMNSVNALLVLSQLHVSKHTSHYLGSTMKQKGLQKWFRDNHVLKTALFETVISRSSLCNLGKKIRQYESTDSLLSDGINFNIIWYIVV